MSWTSPLKIIYLIVIKNIVMIIYKITNQVNGKVYIGLTTESI